MRPERLARRHGISLLTVVLAMVSVPFHHVFAGTRTKNRAGAPRIKSCKVGKLS